jgi:CTP-dependent riboflavin kinase
MEIAEDAITKAELNMLEKMFAAEIEHAISKSKLSHIFQSKSKLLEKLEGKGLVARHEFNLGGNLPMTIKGWLLTHSGRFTFCANC